MRALVDLFVCNQYTKERWIVQFAKYTRKNFAFSIHFDIIYNHFVDIYSRILPKMQEKYFFLLRAKELRTMRINHIINLQMHLRFTFMPM